jgi:hypothetical protein
MLGEAVAEDFQAPYHGMSLIICSSACSTRSSLLSRKAR